MSAEARNAGGAVLGLVLVLLCWFLIAGWAAMIAVDILGGSVSYWDGVALAALINVLLIRLQLKSPS